MAFSSRRRKSYAFCRLSASLILTAPVLELLQRLPERRSLQLPIADPAHELQRLRDELDLPYPAGTEFDVLQ